MATDSEIRDNDLEIRNKIKEVIKQLKIHAKDIGIDNNTFPIDWDKTEQLLFDSYIKAMKESPDIDLNVIDTIMQYNKNVFSDILQFMKRLKNSKNPFKNVYISAVSGFVASLWYDTIAQFESEELESEFVEFQKKWENRAKYYADLLPVIKASIYATSFSWLNRAQNEYTDVNRDSIINNIYKIYKEGVKNSEKRDSAIKKIYSFLDLIRNIENFFYKYKQTQVNFLASESYTKLRQAIVEGLNSFASMNVEKCQGFFDELKQAVFEKATAGSSLYNEYDESALNDEDIINKINNSKLLLSSEYVEKFNLNECFRYFGNDLIEKLYQRVKDKDISSAEANGIISYLCNIANMRKDLLNLNLTVEENDKLEKFDNDIFLRARQLALNLASTFNNNPILNNFTTIKDFADAVHTSTSALRREREKCFTKKYNQLNYESSSSNTSFDQIINIIDNRKLDDFLELSNSGEPTLKDTLKQLKTAYTNKKNSNLANAKKSFSQEKWNKIIKNLQNMIDDICTLQESAEIIKTNANTWEELHPKLKASNLLTGYRKLIGEFIRKINDLCVSETINDINKAIYI